jgi:hypothetical protein
MRDLRDEAERPVDLVKRERAHHALQRFVGGETTNDDFESAYPAPNETSDPGIHAIESVVWRFFSDHDVHKLTGDHAPDPEGRAMLDRCLLFLRTKLRYRWPITDFIVPQKAEPILNFLTAGRMQRRLDDRHRTMEQQMADFGDVASWPFVDHQELEAARRNAHT